MPHESLQMTPAVPRLPTAEAFDLQPSQFPARGLRDLFRPLNELLACGGDPRLALDLARGVNAYGCGPRPSPQTLSFASSTASAISKRAYERAGAAREELMHAAITTGLEEAFDARMEEMREELKACLRLAPGEVDIVFSPSGTDAQLHALFLARSLLGPALTTIVVGADQTGSGTAYTARGRHFAAVTASEREVRLDGPITGLSCDSIALPLIDRAPDIRMRADADLAVLEAVEAAVEGGAGVLLQIMDSSKLGWRAPSQACLDEIARRWPNRVRIVVDACQMRLGRRRLKAYLDHGYMVMITGSKYFGGPAFSGALLVPAALSRWVDRNADVAPGLLNYTSRSDWPKGLRRLRNRFQLRISLGQWLRWEAALDEIEAYYRVPDAFRSHALRELREGIESLIMLSPSLGPIGSASETLAAEDQEFAHPTIFPFTIRRRERPLSVGECRAVYHALARDISEAIGGSDADRAIAAGHCLVGQPVRIERQDEEAVGVLRLCVGARLVTEAWSPDAELARQNLERELDRIACVIAKIELLLACNTELARFAHGV